MNNNEEMQKKDKSKYTKKYLWLAILLFAMFVSSPIIVKLLVSIKILDDVTNEWIGFYGSYFATIITVGLSLFILQINRNDSQESDRQTKKNNEEKIIQERNQNKESQELLLKTNQDIINNSIKPFINAWHVEGCYGESFKIGKRKYDYVLRDHGEFIMWLNYENASDYIWEKYFETELAIENVGVGPIINLEVQFAAKIGLFKSDERITINRDDGIVYRLFIPRNFITPDGNKIVFKYGDIYGNKYMQHIEFGAREDVSGMWTLTKFRYISIQESCDD